MQISGLWVPAVTPFRDGAVDTISLARLCERLLADGAAGIVACGSTGETASLGDDEYAGVVSTVASVSPNCAAGVFKTATAAARRQAEVAVEHGAGAVLVLTPTLVGAAPAEIDGHYRTLAEALPVPVHIYNFPTRTGIVLTAAQVLGLAGVANIRGIKHSASVIDATFTDIAVNAPDTFSVVTGSAGVFWPALAVGAAGGILAAANVHTRELRAIWDAAQAGDLAGAAKQHRELWPLLPGVEGMAAIKARLAARGVIASAEVRPPLTAA